MSASAKKFGWQAVHKLTGIRLSTSTIYDDWAECSANFLAPSEKIRPKIPSSLQLDEPTPGMATVILRAIKVTKAQGLLPYNEFSIEVSVLHRGKNQDLPGSFVLYMPVTSEEARWGGVEIVGLPKFMADISFEESPDYVKCQVKAKDKDILYFEIKKMPTQPQSWDWYIYGVRDSRLLRTHLFNEGQRAISDAKAGASFSLGTHPIAEEIKELEISPDSTQHEYSYKIRSLEDRPLEVE